MPHIDGLISDIKVSSTRQKYAFLILPVVVGIAVLVLIPFIHLGVLYRFWATNKPPVDRTTCRCDCWDTIFKGSYEKPPARYKHVYFNITNNTLGIWIVTIVSAVAVYEAMCYLTKLVIQKNLRFSMFALFLSVIYPHYYSWWMYFNYLNDDFYHQWYHQMFFSITELISTYIVLRLCDRQQETLPVYLLAIISIAFLHILASGADQFVINVLFGEGKGFQIYRDVGFMLPDLLHLAVPACEWLRWSRDRRVAVWHTLSRHELLVSGGLVASLWGLSRLL